MKMTLVAAMALAVLVLVSSAATACPASYVQGIGHDNSNNPSAGKARQVADAYLTEKGVAPESPAGQVIRPYVIGTTIVDDQWGIHGLQGKSVDQCVQDCLGCWHHTQHFDDGKRDAASAPVQPATQKTAG